MIYTLCAEHNEPFRDTFACPLASKCSPRLCTHLQINTQINTITRTHTHIHNPLVPNCVSSGRPDSFPLVLPDNLVCMRDHEIIRATTSETEFEMKDFSFNCMQRQALYHCYANRFFLWKEMVQSSTFLFRKYKNKLHFCNKFFFRLSLAGLL